MVLQAISSNDQSEPEKNWYLPRHRLLSNWQPELAVAVLDNCFAAGLGKASEIFDDVLKREDRENGRFVTASPVYRNTSPFFQK